MRISDWSSDVCSADLGASALVAALSVAGLPSDRFVFEGFLPAKSGARRARLAALAGEPRTLLFYESSHRIEDTLADCVAAFGADRAGVVARELRSEEHTSELQSLMRTSYAVLCLTKNKHIYKH